MLRPRPHKAIAPRAHARFRQVAITLINEASRPRVLASVSSILAFQLEVTCQKLEMANVSKVISVLEEAADMLKSGQTESSSSLSSTAGQGPSTSRSEPRSFPRATTSTNEVGRTDFR